MAELTGMSFPFRFANGGIQLSRGDDKIRENLMQLISTHLGERVMLRDYGAGLHSRRQDPNDAATRALVKFEIDQALQRYLPEVELAAPIEVTGEHAELRIVLLYRVDADEFIRRLEMTVP